MMLDIQQIHEVEELCFDVDGRQCDFPPGAGKLRASIHLEAHVRKIGKELAFEGQISTVVELNCARCLKPHNEILHDTFAVVYRPKPTSEMSVDEIELDGSDLNIYYYTGEVISISELVRDQLLLLLPVKPLCRPDCAGICPSCGKNLNRGPCNCVTESLDPRLAVLGELLKKTILEKSE